MSNFIEELRSRNLIAQITLEDELKSFLSAPQTVYCGFDPTAESLHIGHLLPVMTLARWQRAGHRVIAVMGGGTAMIGDPTGKTDMRQMITEEVIDGRIENFKRQAASIIDFKDSKRGIMVDNGKWLRPLQYLPFLREIGSQFSVNKMLTAECFKSRLETGLSFLEFNYMLLQSYDFLHLYRTEKCTIQIGGDDQWSNMLAGVDLVRRQSRARAYCMTLPLFTTSDGRKMGKTEAGAVWLDPNLMSPYDYFQFWRNVPDEIVGKSLRQFTFLGLDEISELDKLSGHEINQAKVVLAYEATKIVHGEEEAVKAKSAASKLFSSGTAESAAEGPTVDLSDAQVGQGVNIVDLLVLANIVPSKGEARRLVEQGGVFIDSVKIGDVKALVPRASFEKAGGLLLKKGKKHYYYLRLST